MIRIKRCILIRFSVQCDIFLTSLHYIAVSIIYSLTQRLTTIWKQMFNHLKYSCFSSLSAKHNYFCVEFFIFNCACVEWSVFLEENLPFVYKIVGVVSNQITLKWQKYFIFLSITPTPFSDNQVNSNLESFYIFNFNYNFKVNLLANIPNTKERGTISGSLYHHLNIEEYKSISKIKNVHKEQQCEQILTLAFIAQPLKQAFSIMSPAMSN